MKKSMKNMEEMIKKIMTVSTKYVEEEIVIDIKYMEKDVENMMVINSGAPILLVSLAWFERYVKGAKIDEEEVKKGESYRKFRLGKTS